MLSLVYNLRMVSRFAVRGLSSIPEIDIRMYEKRADETLESISDYVSDIGETLSADIDVSLSMGVLSMAIAQSGTFVINKQRPNLQLWLSSPVSGPRRYDLRDGKWICAREREGLDVLLTREFTTIFPSHPIDFSSHV
ncbi:hypothetical protein PENTCL1PPCAC_6585 [Pristionchus entomophagus]|uniref:ferroxidase n=1 Tax=Pristionchus entomophagus TaxID=358040 RepID=A0AAV5SN38_9BILA|nr:hypothetical protein PENTCL1PPCAC_6585 [Pristionchus entomophagus]